ncbi:MAG: hypothetical protein M3Q80_01355 [bacterium]|nr:hypothetical protein [bacterium]
MNAYFTKTLKQSVVALCIFTLAFLVCEPAISSAVEDQFTITQSVTSEISFQTPATDIVLSPSLAGITGGTSNGGTQVVVLTNNAAGYTMTLTASSSVGMLGNSQGGNIPALVAVSGTPNFALSAASAAPGANKAAFGYTVEASTTADLDQSFKDNGSACNTGAADAADSCWLNASTSAETIINRTTATTASGATTTLKFRVVIRSSPSPAITQDTYVATTTLTATTN